MSESMIAVAGGEVWAGEDGDGPPLVLLHPGIGDSRIWDPIRPALTGDYRVIRYDARGFGRSPAPTTEYTLLDDLVAVLDHFGLDRVPIVGCSQGGAAALGLAVTDPARVTALVLLCPGIPGFAWPDDPESDAAYEAAVATSPEAVARFTADIWAAGGPTPEVDEQLLSSAVHAAARDTYEQRIVPVFDRLGEISVPSSLLVGDADWPPLIEANLQAAARIPGCELIEVPGLDHLPPLRVPDLVLSTIRATLDRIR